LEGDIDNDEKENNKWNKIVFYLFNLL
jgi:hypothetical protein